MCKVLLPSITTKCLAISKLYWLYLYWLRALYPETSTMTMQSLPPVKMPSGLPFQDHLPHNSTDSTWLYILIDLNPVFMEIQVLSLYTNILHALSKMPLPKHLNWSFVWLKFHNRFHFFVALTFTFHIYCHQLNFLVSFKSYYHISVYSFKLNLPLF